MNINAVNLPAAVVAIMFRKLIDLHLGKLPHRILAKGPWLLDYVSPGSIYVYVIGAICTYLGSHIKKGTIVNLAKRCSKNAASLKDKYLLKRRCLRRNRSWILRNLLSNRDDQQRALAYLTSQIPINRSLLAGAENILDNGPNGQQESELNQEIAQTSTAALQAAGDDDRSQSSQISFYTDLDGTKEPDVCADENQDKPKVQSTEANAAGDYGEICFNNDNVENPVSVEGSEECNLSDLSEIGIYTPSVIREIIPSECSDDCFKMPFKARRIRRQKDTTNKANAKKKLPGRKKANAKKRLPVRNKAVMVKKTRSGRVYGFKGTHAPFGYKYY